MTLSWVVALARMMMCRVVWMAWLIIVTSLARESASETDSQEIAEKLSSLHQTQGSKKMMTVLQYLLLLS